MRLLIFEQLLQLTNSLFMSSDNFRKLLEQFYTKINKSPYLDVYKKILSEQFDEAEVQPIHIITLNQQPSVKNVKPLKKQQKKVEFLYKNTDFASTFLFAFLLDLLHRGQMSYLQQVQKRVNENLQMFYGEKQLEDSIRYKYIFNGLFQFCHYILTKEYEVAQIEKLFKSFFNNTFQRRGLKKNDRQKYGTECQNILSFILAMNNIFPSKKDLSEPSSDTYQLNYFNFCINVQNSDLGQQWNIGQGQNHINIAKERGQYLVYEQQIAKQESEQQNLTETWLSILSESQQIRKQQSDKTSRIFLDLNIAECKSPSKSSRPAKNLHFRDAIPRNKIGQLY